MRTIHARWEKLLPNGWEMPSHPCAFNHSVDPDAPSTSIPWDSVTPRTNI